MNAAMSRNEATWNTFHFAFSKAQVLNKWQVIWPSATVSVVAHKCTHSDCVIFLTCILFSAPLSLSPAHRSI